MTRLVALLRTIEYPQLVFGKWVIMLSEKETGNDTKHLVVQQLFQAFRCRPHLWCAYEYRAPSRDEVIFSPTCGCLELFETHWWLFYSSFIQKSDKYSFVMRSNVAYVFAAQFGSSSIMAVRSWSLTETIRKYCKLAPSP